MRRNSPTAREDAVSAVLSPFHKFGIYCERDNTFNIQRRHSDEVWELKELQSGRWY